jgi:hypothetical protein
MKLLEVPEPDYEEARRAAHVARPRDPWAFELVNLLEEKPEINPINPGKYFELCERESDPRTLRFRMLYKDGFTSSRTDHGDDSRRTALVEASARKGDILAKAILAVLKMKPTHALRRDPVTAKELVLEVISSPVWDFDAAVQVALLWQDLDFSPRERKLLNQFLLTIARQDVHFAMEMVINEELAMSPRERGKYVGTLSNTPESRIRSSIADWRKEILTPRRQALAFREDVHEGVRLNILVREVMSGRTGVSDRALAMAVELLQLSARKAE